MKLADSQEYDVVIVGAGIAGATLACALGDSNFRVLLVDQQDAPLSPQAEYDLRVSSINAGSARILQSIGAWAHFNTERQCPFHAMRVWDEQGSGVTTFDAADIGETCFGYITENRLSCAALLKSAAAFNNVEFKFGDGLEHLDVQDRHVYLQFTSGAQIRARLLVGADGGRSQIRDKAGIEMTFKDYGQRTIVATVQPQHDHENTAWQRFLSSGPVAYLPLADGSCSLAWHTNTALAEERLAQPTIEFEQALAVATDHCLGDVQLKSERNSFPLFRGHATHYVLPRVALIGDAAHVIHPLAGLGANIGISDAASLAQVLMTHATRDPGKLSVLRRYERWRRGENAAIVAATDAFHHAFVSKQPFLSKLRNTGLNLAQNNSLLKQHVMRLAAGVSGDVPELATFRQVSS